MNRLLHIGLILALGALAVLGAVPMPTNYVSVQQFITNHSDFRLTTNNGGVAIYWSPGRLTNFIGTVDQYLRGDITWQTFSNAVHSASTNVYEPVILAGTIYQYYRGDETWQIFGWTNLLYKPATLATGTGVVSRLTKWDSTGTNIVDSAVVETNGIVYFTDYETGKVLATTAGGEIVGLTGTENYVPIWNTAGLTNSAIISSNGVIYFTDYDTDKFLLTGAGGEITGHTLTTNSVPGLTNQIISIYSHTTNTSNPHSVTYTQVGASPENHTLEYHPNVTFGTIDEDNIIQRKGANWTNQPISVLTNGLVQGIGTTNRVAKFTGTNIIGDSAILETNGIVYFTDYDTGKVLTTTTGGEISGISDTTNTHLSGGLTWVNTTNFFNYHLDNWWINQNHTWTATNTFTGVLMITNNANNGVTNGLQFTLSTNGSHSGIYEISQGLRIYTQAETNAWYRTIYFDLVNSNRTTTSTPLYLTYNQMYVASPALFNVSSWHGSGRGKYALWDALGYLTNSLNINYTDITNSPLFITGTGTVSRLSKWDSTGTNLVDSAVLETNGVVYFTDYDSDKFLLTSAGGEITGHTLTTNSVPGLTNQIISLYSHTTNTSNPHSVTYTQAGASPENHTLEYHPNVTFGTIDEDNIIQRKGDNWTNQPPRVEWPWTAITNAPSIPGTNGFVQGVGTLNRVSKFTGTNIIGDSAIIETNGVVYFTDYDTDKILQTTTGGEIFGRNIEWPITSITNLPDYALVSQLITVGTSNYWNAIGDTVSNTSNSWNTAYTHSQITDGSNPHNTVLPGTNGFVQGIGTVNYLSKFTGTNFIGNSQMFDDGTSIGIGINTPTYMVQLFGAGQTTASITDGENKGGMLFIQDSGSGVGNGGAVLFGASVATANAPQAAIKSLLINGDLQGLADLVFVTRALAANTNLTERMRITYDGKVGIGASSPTHDLQINRAGETVSLLLNGEADQMEGIFFGYPTEVANFAIYRPLSTDTLRIWHTSGGDKVTFTATGLVGIGTNDPTYTIDVPFGTARFGSDTGIATLTSGVLGVRNVEWPWSSITNPPTIPSGDGDLIDGTNILMNTTGSLADRLFGSGDITVNVIGNGDLIAGTGVTLGGTLTDRLLGNGDVTINSTVGITGSGTETYIPIWSGATSLGDGPMSYDGSTLTFSPSVQNQFGSLGWIKGLRANLDGGPGSANNSYLGGSEIPFKTLYIDTVRSDSIVNTNSIQSGDYKDHNGTSGADGTNNIATVGDGLVTTLGTTANLVAGTGITFDGDPTNRIVGSGNLTINATSTTQTTFGMMILTNKQSVYLESTNAYTYQGSKITLNSDTAILKVYGTNDPDRCAIQEITGGVDGRILIIMNSIFEGQPLHIIVGCTNATSTNNVIALSPSEVLTDPYDQRFSPGYNKANPTLIYDGDANKWILMDKSTGI